MRIFERIITLLRGLLLCLIPTLVFAQSPGDVVINEIAWMGTAASTADEWIELYNTTNSAIDITGWTLAATDGTPSIVLSGIIPANGYFLLERTDDNTISDITADQIYTGDLGNGGETLELRDDLANLIDTANSDGGGWPAGDNSSAAARASMERIDPSAADTDANWGTNDGLTTNGLDADSNPLNGTPKAQNSVVTHSFTVINTDEAGFGSLRKAIDVANGVANLDASTPDTIKFDITGAGPHTISPTSALPDITDPVVFDGLSQAGAVCSSWPPALLIELDGTNAGIGASGLTVGATGSGSTIRGLVINRFSGNGIELSSSNKNLIECNLIGTDVTGATDLGNAVDGVHIGDGANNVVGGSATDKRNLISGNDEEGVDILGSGGSSTTGNLVQGNYIGTNATGTAAIPNHSYGVSIGDAQTNTIGGATAAARNVISGNDRDGIGIGGILHAGNTVRNNFIGVNAAGTGALPNALNGVVIDAGSTVTIANNVISGNGTNGVALRATTGNVVQGNFIGTNAGATMPLGNGENGVVIGFEATTSSSNTIGGTASGEGNTIAFNGQDGVAVVDGSGNAILGNAIHSNGELGIDLGNNGVTANDLGDADGSPNMFQNFPVLSSATTNAGDITIDGTFNSTPNMTGFRIEFFSNSACDASDHGEGDTFIGFTTVNTDGSGDASFSVNLSATVPVGRFITATATAPDPDNSTSEFSQCVETVTAAGKSFVLLADDDVIIDRQVDSEGNIHSNNDITFKKGNSPQSLHTGNLTAADDIDINKRNKIIGTAEAGDDIDNDGEITGGFTEHAGIAEVPLPVIAPFNHGQQDIKVDDGETLALNFGDYDDVKVEDKATLKLSAGTYNLDNLKMDKKSVLEIDVSGGEVIINIDDKLKIGKSVTMVVNGPTTLVTFNIAGDEKIVIGSGTLWLGNLIAPEATVELGSQSRFQGAICAETIIVKKNARFVSHGFGGSFPKIAVPLTELEPDEEEGEEEVTNEQSPVTSYQLEQNYPNPFNPSTEISFQLPVASQVKLVIYSLTGQVVRELVNGGMTAGRHAITWNGRNRAGEVVAGGVYLYRLTIERNGEAPMVITKKMTLLK